MKLMENNKMLLQYSSFAAAFLTIQSVIDAQVIYTNIEPDIVLDNDFEMDGVDMDNNGSYDFAFLNISYTYTSGIHITTYVERIFAGVYGTSANEIAGTHNLYFFPYALTDGFSINSSLIFQNAGYQRMAWRDVLFIETWAGEDTLVFTGSGGEWFPELLDHYLGVHFVDENHDYHFGWIRCDVKNEGRTLVVKDYAYEAEIDKPIVAGDVGDTSIIGIEELLDFNFNITILENALQVVGSYQTVGSSIFIYGIDGNELYSGLMDQTQKIIPLNVPAGIYIISFAKEFQRISKKIYLQ